MFAKPIMQAIERALEAAKRMALSSCRSYRAQAANANHACIIEIKIGPGAGLIIGHQEGLTFDAADNAGQEHGINQIIHVDSMANTDPPIH